MSKRIPWVVSLTILGIVASILIGFFLLNTNTMETWYQQSAFYFIMIAFGLWLQRMLPKKFEPQTIVSFIKHHYMAILVASILILLSTFASKTDFKILSDETNLLGISMTMYDSHMCYNTTRVLNKYHGIKTIIGKRTDMRPIFFPYLVYLVHSIIGYNAFNAFIVNALAGLLCLFFLYLLISRWLGRFWGITGMLLLASYPLFITYVTSCGFEIVNLLFALIAFVLFDNFLKNKSAINVERLFLLLPLLAQTRYESALAVFCIVPFALWKLSAKQYQELTPRIIAIPFLFIPLVWLRVITFTPRAFQVSNVESAFGLQLFFKNIGKALEFFIGIDVEYGIVPIVSFVAIIGFLWTIVDYVKSKKENENNPFLLVIVSLLFLTTQACARFSYYWGNLTQPYVFRLGIIFLPFLVIFAVYALNKFVQRKILTRNWIIVATILLITYSWPVAGNLLGVRDIAYYRNFSFTRQYLERNQPNKDSYIIVAAHPNFYVPLGYSAITFSDLDTKTDQIFSDLNNKQYQKIIVIQKISISKQQPVKKYVLKKKYNLKTIYETRLHHSQYIRISEISNTNINCKDK